MEWLDIVDETGNPTGETIERTEAHAKGIRHRTSHLWLARRHNGAVQILLQKRSADKDSHPGCYDISSAGHIPAGCSYEESAIRELKEELGVSAETDQLIYCGQRCFGSDRIFHGKPFHDRQVSNIYLLWLDLPEDGFTVQESEVESVRWMDFSDCLEGVRAGTFPNCIYEEELLIIQNVF